MKLGRLGLSGAAAAILALAALGQGTGRLSTNGPSRAFIRRPTTAPGQTAGQDASIVPSVGSDGKTEWGIMPREAALAAAGAPSPLRPGFRPATNNTSIRPGTDAAQSNATAQAGR